MMSWQTGWLGISALTACLLLTGCTSLRQTLQNRPCVLDDRVPYDVIVVDFAQHNLALYWLDPATGDPFGRFNRLKAWLDNQEDSVLAITNAGIYEADLSPAGLFIEQGQVLHPLNQSDGYGNFYLKPNGVFYTSPHGAGIADASRFGNLQDSVTYAIQSGPLLLSDSRIHPAFTPGSRNCRLRSGVGVTSDGIVHIAISNGAVNFHDFAVFFRDTLGAVDALYLDGAISALYAPQLGRSRMPRTRFGAFLVITVPK